MSLLITVEGLDGSGKSTLTKALVEEMNKDSAFARWIFETKEPGSMFTGVGPDLRKLVLDTPDFRPFEREMLFYVDASVHSRFIGNQGDAIVVSDRGMWSHLAYVRGYLKTGQIDFNDYRLCKELIRKVCTKPDCVVFINSTLELMAERLAGKAQDAIEKNGREFFEAVAETYGDLVQERALNKLPMIVLDSNQTVRQSVDRVINYLKETFKYEELKQGNRVVCRI